MSSPISDCERLAREEEGGALVEAALTLPIIVALVFAIIEFGLYLWEQNSAVKAAQLGARLAVTSDPVAIGPGLTSAPITGALGASCRLDPATNPCVRYDAVCTSTGCTTRSHSMGATLGFSQNAFNAVVGRMRDIYPALQAESVEISYVSNGLGFVGMPGAVPGDVTVRIVAPPHRFVVLGAFTPLIDLRVRASSTLPSEDLRS